MSEDQINTAADLEATGKPEPRVGFARLIPALHISISGLIETYKSESAFRQEIKLFVVMFPLALMLGATTVEKVLLIAPLFLVLVVELLNTALEQAVDRWGYEYNDFSKAAKDAGSAAVLCSILLVICTWTIILVVPMFG